MLAYLDSNQDKQNQNLSYYHYTIGQSVLLSKRECKNTVWSKMFQKNLEKVRPVCGPGN